MKDYKTPEFELVEYEVEDCLDGSTNIPVEEENIGGIVGDLT